MALLGVLLILFLVTGLIAGLTVSGQTEVKIASNYEAQAKSQMAAEAGLNHAVAVTITYLSNFQANGFADPQAAMSALYRGPDGLTGTTATDADNGSLENLGIPRTPTTTALTTDTTYQARVFDEDDTNRGVTLGAVDLLRIEEDGNAYADSNNKIVVRAIGTGPNNATLTLEAIVNVLPGVAILVNGDLDISGNVDPIGALGSVHANGDLDLSGSAIDISEDCTATGTYSTSGNPTCGGANVGGGFPSMPIPDTQASAHFNAAEVDWILNADGTITNWAGTVQLAALFPGWSYGSGTWTHAGNALTPGTYYVHGSADLSGNSTSVVSIIAEGSISVTSNTTLTPDDGTLLFFADGDLRITGSPNLNPGAGPEVQIIVREQIRITGSPDVRGQIIVQNRASVFNDVTGTSSISGSLDISYNGSMSGAAGIQARSWREMP